MHMGINQCVEDPDRKKARKGDALPLLEPGHPSAPALGYQRSWFSSLQTQTMTDTIGSHGSWALECGLKYPPTSPGSPAHRRQIMGLSLSITT